MNVVWRMMIVLGVWALALGGTARADDAVRAEVEAVLQRMERAVVAGDAAAYLALIDPTDAVFAKEQENWAKDLAKKKPETFTLSIVADEKPEKPKDGGEREDVGEGVPTKFESECAQFRMKMAWRTPGKNRDRVVTYPVRLVKKEGAGGSREWRYQGEVWNAVEKPADERFNGVRVLYEPGSERLKKLAEVVAKVMPEVRSSVDHHFRLKAPGVQTVKLYLSMRHLQSSIWLSYEDPLGGWNEPGESIKILPTMGAGEGSLKVLLAHEYGHVASFHLGPKATDAPWWSLEGSADLAASLFKASGKERRDRTVRGWAKRGELADWKKIAPFPLPAEDNHLQPMVYTQGEHMLAYIAERFGDEGRISFMKELCGGKSVEEASTKALGLSWSDVDAAWRETLAAPAPAPVKQPEGDRAP